MIVVIKVLVIFIGKIFSNVNFCPTGCCAVMSTNETTPVFSQGEMSSKTVTDNDSDDEDESKLMSQPVWHSLSPSPNDNELTNINQG